MRKIIDLSGQKYHNLSVLRLHDKRAASGDAVWECLCDCGKTANVPGHNLRSGNTKSCGCLGVASRIKHGHSVQGARSRVYNIWLGVVQRCTNPNRDTFSYYGGRGITICDRWKDFNNFYEDMGDPPEGHTLERKDNNVGYAKDNCVWATKEQQSNNTRRNRYIEVDGVKLTVAQWAKLSGVPAVTIIKRLNNGIPPEQAIIKRI